MEGKDNHSEHHIEQHKKELEDVSFERTFI